MDLTSKVAFSTHEIPTGELNSALPNYFNGLDLVITPEREVRAPLAYGYYATYEHYWKNNIYSNFTYGLVHIEKYAHTDENAFLEGFTCHVNTFWDITEGDQDRCGR